MKEKYFTAGNCSLKAREWRQEISARPRFAFTPPSSALLIIDVQDFFIRPDSHACLPAAQAILGGLNRLADLYKQHTLPVIFTRHLNTDEDAGLMGRWWRDPIRRENPLSQITTQLETSDALVIEKTQYDAFHRTTLESVLRERRVTQLVIGGVIANLCCETTARSAFVRGFEVFFLADGTAAYTEQHHLAALRNLAFGFAVLAGVEEIAEALERPHAR